MSKNALRSALAVLTATLVLAGCGEEVQLEDGSTPGMDAAVPDADGAVPDAALPDGAVGACTGLGAACATSAECCSGACEMTPGGLACVSTDVCGAVGASCAIAADCCSLGCSGGSCVGCSVGKRGIPVGSWDGPWLGASSAG